jgi:hypothetical protein
VIRLEVASSKSTEHQEQVFSLPEPSSRRIASCFSNIGVPGRFPQLRDQVPQTCHSALSLQVSSEKRATSPMPVKNFKQASIGVAPNAVTPQSWRCRVPRWRIRR